MLRFEFREPIFWGFFWCAFGHDSYPKASQDQFQIDIYLGTASNMASNSRFSSLSLEYNPDSTVAPGDLEKIRRAGASILLSIE
jgi:hypothetical protein